MLVHDVYLGLGAVHTTPCRVCDAPEVTSEAHTSFKTGFFSRHDPFNVFAAIVIAVAVCVSVAMYLFLMSVDGQLRAERLGSEYAVPSKVQSLIVERNNGAQPSGTRQEDEETETMYLQPADYTKQVTQHSVFLQSTFNPQQAGRNE